MHISKCNAVTQLFDQSCRVSRHVHVAIALCQQRNLQLAHHYFHLCDDYGSHLLMAALASSSQLQVITGNPPTRLTLQGICSVCMYSAIPA